MIGITKFLKEVRAELTKVSWPDRRQTARLTAVVIGASLLVGIYLSALDYILTKVMAVVLTR